MESEELVQIDLQLDYPELRASLKDKNTAVEAHDVA